MKMKIIIILVTFLKLTSTCEMSVRPRLCFTCSYLTMFDDKSQLGNIRVKNACNNIKEKCCIKTRPSASLKNEKVDRRTSTNPPPTNNKPDKSLRKQIMLARKFLI